MANVGRGEKERDGKGREREEGREVMKKRGGKERKEWEGRRKGDRIKGNKL